MEKLGAVSTCIDKICMLAALFLLLCFTTFSQCLTSSEYGDQLIKIEKDTNQPVKLKLSKVIDLKRNFNLCRLPEDSVYAKILHRLGALQWSVGRLNEAIKYTIQSISINNSGRKGTSRKLTVNSYYNIGFFYWKKGYYIEALEYFDQCITAGRGYPDSSILYRVVDARLKKGNIYYQTGDFEKGMDEMSHGLETARVIRNTALRAALFIERAQAFAAMEQHQPALKDAENALPFISENDYSTLANYYKIRAIISEADSNYDQAIYFHKKVIDSRSMAKDSIGLAGDYNDAGNTYTYTKKFREAGVNYKKSLLLAQKSGAHGTAAKALNNLAIINLFTENYPVALSLFQNSLLLTVPSFQDTNGLVNPSREQTKLISDKNFLSLLLQNKVKCIFNLYRQTNNAQYLSSAIKTAVLADAVITEVRHEQSGEQSKLFWRNKTREFFTDAIEACYQDGNAERAFYFMEKSRAVLLNDKLNELGSSASLPPAEAAMEKNLQKIVLYQQQKLLMLEESDPSYVKERIKLIDVKGDLDAYIKTLQKNFPVYYQYKYADDVPTLHALQKYLSRHEQNFVHYFVSDTFIYMLAVTPETSKFVRVLKGQSEQQLIEFSNICSDEQKQKKNNSPFASLSYSVYQTLFKPLDFLQGRVIICYDDLPIPFEALSTDASGKNFLIYKYVFSYVYSARSLLKKFKNPAGKGNFLGVAPVTYAGDLHLPSLQESENCLKNSSDYYSGSRLLSNKEANRKNLLELLPYYTIVTILSHASADSSEKEPLLFMADSTIKLSELQLFKSPSTELILLSACQTNVGKMVTGEGIFSLARGFASAGIPSVTATLWVANEGPMYSITEAFLYNISTGMRKDDALRKAKLTYMQNENNQEPLPFYWANIILAGNSEPVRLSKKMYPVYWILGSILLTALLSATIFLLKKRK